MSTSNSNYKIVPLSSGANGPFGTPTGATVVHEVFCTGAGSVTIVAIGGGSMTVTLAVGQSVKVMCSRITVNSGTFVGFSPSVGGAYNLIRS